jgi:hypothetical protein
MELFQYLNLEVSVTYCISCPLKYGKNRKKVANFEKTKKVDGNELMRLSREFPVRTRNTLKRHGYLSAA